MNTFLLAGLVFFLPGTAGAQPGEAAGQTFRERLRAGDRVTLVLDAGVMKGKPGHGYRRQGAPARVSGDPSDVIGTTVGGHRYGWFVIQEFQVLAFDNASLLSPGVAGIANACKNGGWQDLTRLDGTPFQNQGDCVQYVAAGK